MQIYVSGNGVKYIDGDIDFTTAKGNITPIKINDTSVAFRNAITPQKSFEVSDIRDGANGSYGVTADAVILALSSLVFKTEGGGIPTTPGLQAVTDVQNVSTNPILVNRPGVGNSQLLGGILVTTQSGSNFASFIESFKLSVQSLLNSFKTNLIYPNPTQENNIYLQNSSGTLAFVPVVLRSLTNQQAAIGTTTIYIVAVTGVYQLNIMTDANTTGTRQIISQTITHTRAGVLRTKAVAVSGNLSTLNYTNYASPQIYCDAGTQITYSNNLLGTTGSYNLEISIQNLR
jgi:hypothetical protein